MSDINSTLLKCAKELNISITDQQLKAFDIYCDLLLEWNEKINLTAITDKNLIAVKHFADSISVLSYVNVKKNCKLIDVGTGAGFPGIPLAIMRNDIKLTLLDSLNKRLIFLKEVTNILGIECEIIHSRAEEGSRQENLRDKFDIAISRAVAPLNILSEYCMPFVKSKGMFISMKGPNVQEEINNSTNAIALLGGKVNNVKTFTLGDNNTRSIVVIDKLNKTKKEYPRHGSKISKQPL
ncbi:MAG TPA: 16S rRNA (guanine(527)-N(7))-methyltransferase RsmG [Clostridiales bacterium]|nr:16S rRNA (guanine(527)-N(7))-methyltransferase RsmG [Clostridiales bacterium]